MRSHACFRTITIIPFLVVHILQIHRLSLLTSTNSAMNTHHAPIAVKPSCPYNPSSFYAMAPPMGSPSMSLAASTPSLVPRSLTSTPSSTLVSEDEAYRTGGALEDTLNAATLGLESYIFDTEDNASLPWYTGKTLIPCLHSFASSSTPRPEVQRPFIESAPRPHVPNPHALSYIPTVSRRRDLADSVNRGRIDNPWKNRREWVVPFRHGAVSCTSQIRRSFALDIAYAGPWDTAIISELAAKFIERVAEGQSECSGFVAPFVLQVYEAFCEAYGSSELADMFTQQLKQCLLSEFRAWWLPVSLWPLRSLVSLRSEWSISGSPHCHPPSS